MENRGRGEKNEDFFPVPPLLSVVYERRLRKPGLREKRLPLIVIFFHIPVISVIVPAVIFILIILIVLVPAAIQNVFSPVIVGISISVGIIGLLIVGDAVVVGAVIGDAVAAGAVVRVTAGG